ncbi:hypothetical protein SprV_0401392400 [Sparganum proliferum]
MVGPPVRTRDRLRHQHVTMVSPPDEDIVQQVPLTRPRMPPSGLLSYRQAEERVRQDEAVFCAGAEEEEAVLVGAAETMRTQHTPPDSMVCADAGVEVTEDNQLVRLRSSRQECVQVLVKIVSRGVGAGHRRSVGADDGMPDARTLTCLLAGDWLWSLRVRPMARSCDLCPLTGCRNRCKSCMPMGPHVIIGWADRLPLHARLSGRAGGVMPRVGRVTSGWLFLPAVKVTTVGGAATRLPGMSAPSGLTGALYAAPGRPDED